jgi:hypothetical protein
VISKSFPVWVNLWGKAVFAGLKRNVHDTEFRRKWVKNRKVVGQKKGEKVIKTLDFTEKSSVFGAGSRTRTDDLRITNALLYQLSYTSIFDCGDYDI